MDGTSVVLRIEARVHTEWIEGRIAPENGEWRAFAGWLGLLTALSDLLDGAVLPVAPADVAGHQKEDT